MAKRKSVNEAAYEIWKDTVNLLIHLKFDIGVAICAINDDDNKTAIELLENAMRQIQESEYFKKQ
jgi:hypothetical protein